MSKYLSWTRTHVEVRDLGDDGLVQDCTVKCLSIDGLACLRVQERLHMLVSILLVFGGIVPEVSDGGLIKSFGVSFG